MLGGLLRFLILLALVMFAGMVAMAAVKAAFALVLGLFFLLLPFLILYGVFRLMMGGVRVFDPQRIATAPRRARSPRRRFPWQAPVFTPAPEENPGAWVREAQDTAKDIARLVRKGDRASREALSGVPGSAKRLADRVRDLARSYQSLNQHLHRDDAASLSRRAAAMEQRAYSATDPVTRDQYLAAAQSLGQQAQVHLELVAAHDRVRSEVARILATLANLRTRLVAVSSGAASATTDINTAAEELAGLQSQVDTFHDSVRQVLRQSATNL